MKARHDMLDREDLIMSALTDSQREMFIEYQAAERDYEEQVRRILVYVSKAEGADK